MALYCRDKTAQFTSKNMATKINPPPLTEGALYTGRGNFVPTGVIGRLQKPYYEKLAKLFNDAGISVPGLTSPIYQLGNTNWPLRRDTIIANALTGSSATSRQIKEGLVYKSGNLVKQVGTPEEVFNAYVNYYSQDALEKRLGTKLPYDNFFLTNTQKDSDVFFQDPKKFYSNELTKLGNEYYNAHILPLFNQSQVTPAGAELAKKRKEELEQKIKTVSQRAATAGFTVEDSAKAIQDKVLSLYEFDYNAAKEIERKNKSGILGFVGEWLPTITNVGMALVTGGLTLPQQLAINSTAALVQGAKPEDVVKSIFATVAASQVPDVLKAVKATSSNDVLNAALENSLKQATYAQITGQDVGKAAIAGGIGGATAQTFAKATDSAAVSRAAGEFSQGVAAGQSPEAAMINALGGFLETDRAEAKRKIETEVEAKRISQLPAIDDVTPYRPQFGSATAALAGSEIGGAPVSDVQLSAGQPSDPKLFDKGEMRRPTGAAVGNLYEVRNNLGEVFQARDITYQTGEVQRVIFDPKTGTYQQQMLKTLSDLKPDAGTLPGITVTAEQDPSDVAEILAFLKPQTKEFNKALLNLSSQDLRDITGLLSVGAASNKESPFAADALTKFKNSFDAAEAKAIELEKAAIANPTSENIAAAKAAQNEAITAKFQLSQALTTPSGIYPGAPSTDDLSKYNRYPDATRKFIDQGEVVYAKGSGQPGDPVEILGSEPYVTTSPVLQELRPSLLTRPSVGGVESDLEALRSLSLIRAQPLSENFKVQMNNAKAMANTALVNLSNTPTQENLNAVRDALGEYELSQKMYYQASGEELPKPTDEKLASQEFPLVDTALKGGLQVTLSDVQTPVNARMQRNAARGLPGAKPETDPSLLTDIGGGLVAIPKAEFEYMQPNVLARGGLASLRR